MTHDLSVIVDDFICPRYHELTAALSSILGLQECTCKDRKEVGWEKGEDRVT